MISSNITLCHVQTQKILIIANIIRLTSKLKLKPEFDPDEMRTWASVSLTAFDGSSILKIKNSPNLAMTSLSVRKLKNSHSQTDYENMNF